VANETDEFVSAVMAAASYDFDGDGIVDRVELYNAFTVNKSQIAEAAGNISSGLKSGFQAFLGSIDNIDQIIGDEYKDMVKGSITMTVWSPFGSGPLILNVGGLSLDANVTSSEEFSTIKFPFVFEVEGGGGGGGVGEECCDRIDELEADLEDLKARVDEISSRLLNITRTCCNATVGTATTVATATAIETATATDVETATGTGDSGVGTA